MDAPRRDATIVQFSLRSLFVVTLIAAAASAIVAPRVRQGGGLALLALWVGPYVLIVASVCAYRIRLESRDLAAIRLPSSMPPGWRREDEYKDGSHG